MEEDMQVKKWDSDVTTAVITGTLIALWQASGIRIYEDSNPFIAKYERVLVVYKWEIKRERNRENKKQLLLRKNICK
jgi:hypothetical protein